MEHFKLEIFQNEKPGSSFPWFRSLSADEMWIIRQQLATASKLPGNVTSLTLTKRIAELSSRCSDLNAEDEHFRLETVFQRLKINQPQMIYVNWYRYDKVDEMRFAEVADCFDYIWYPGSDDIDFFDATLSWVVSIDHAGYVSAVVFEDRTQA